MRFPAARRLKESSEFAQVRTGGQSFPGRYVVLSVFRLESCEPWRCGLITTRKIGGAVQRNKVRRRLREIIRATPLQDGFWVVTIARWRATEASFAELKEDWTRAARRARILAKESREPTL
jgi:ribonuclease P protein component